MRLLVPLTFAFYSVLASAQLYSWKDADGKVHYSDEPPAAKVPTRKVAPPPAPSGDPNAARKSFAEKEADARKKQKDAQDSAAKSEKEKAEAEERSVNCERAKGNLQGLESGLVRFTTNAKGERVGLEGAARDAEIANARKAVESWCNK